LSSTVTRREFLKKSAGGGLCLLANETGVLAWSQVQQSKDFRPNAYIQISPKDQIEFWLTRCEMGQGVRTLLPLLLAEELEVDPRNIRLRQPVTSPEFKGIRLRTSGSSSASGTWRPLRQAAASAREMLISAAAQQWGVGRKDCKAEAGTVLHVPTGRRLDYGSLASSAAGLPVPKEVPLSSKDFRLIGGRHRRIDGLDIATGRAQYGLDVRLPGMKYAVIAKPPSFGATPKTWNTDAAKRIPGVRDIVPVSSGYAAGIAVTADSVWSAMRAREALQIQWETGSGATFSSDEHYEKLRRATTAEGIVVRHDGQPSPLVHEVFEAFYEWPYQVHAPLEPMNCTAHVKDGKCEIWAPTQAPEEAQRKAAKLLGVSPEDVTVRVMLMGGGFGRRLFTDYVQEAAEIAKSVDYPVQLFWTREDDMRYGHFNPASFNRFVAKLGPDKRPVALLHRCASSDLSIYPPDSPPTAASYAEDWTPWGGYDNPYNFGELTVDYSSVGSPVPTGPWRSVEYPGTVFGRECFLDELAHHAGQDAIAFRTELLKPADIVALGDDLKIDRGRLLRLLEATLEISQWNKPLPQKTGRRWGRGFACNIYHGQTHMAQVAEVSVDDSGDFRVERIACVLDVGQPINLLGIEGQVESAIAWGLTAVLKGGVRFANGQSLATNFLDSPVLSIKESARVEVHVLPSAMPPSGLGEQPVPLVAPAVANALFAATGKRVRRLPIRAGDLRDG
jgi:isoquinoline 1-oxidoreductase beta subunit